MDRSVLKQVDSLKFLGVTIDQHLTWKSHIQYICKKIRTSTGLIYHVSSFLPQKILIHLYYALINSNLSYCIESWGNALPTNIQMLKKIQNKVIRTIFNKTEGSDALYKKANILTLDKLYQLRIAELAFKLFENRPDPTSLPFITRHSLLALPLPPSITQIGHRRVEYQATACWNGLPNQIKLITDPYLFRKTLKQHLISS